jgi:hypothetical protein
MKVLIRLDCSLGCFTLAGLLSTSAKLLMKSALSLRNHSAGSVSDAMVLLELARLGRPSNHKINQALQQLERQADKPNSTRP